MPLMAGFDQLLFIGRFDIVGAHAVEHVAEQVELLVGVGIGRGDRPRRRPATATVADTAPADHQTEGLRKSCCHVHPRASFTPPIHQGDGIDGLAIFPELNI